MTLAASWNDATHTFGGWSGACSGSDTTCMLELRGDATVSTAFTPLPTDRCATSTDADCLRAVYLGAPNDYAQVQDIPESVPSSSPTTTAATTSSAASRSPS